jgi:hypothetical protein
VSELLKLALLVCSTRLVSVLPLNASEVAVQVSVAVSAKKVTSLASENIRSGVTA